MSVATFTKAGTKATTAAKLDKKVFGVTPKNHELLKSAYVAYLANGRDNAAQTKTRGLISGGGRKPWRQKGTGRARVGSIRSPLWRGGGVIFGPTGEENYKHKLSVQAKRQALRQALSVSADKVIIIEDLKVKDHKTAEAAKLLAKIGATRQTLLVVADKTEELIRSTRNLRDIKLVQARYVNVFDVLNANHIVLTQDALKILSDWLGGSK